MSEELWDRQEGESAKAYAAFTDYRDLGSTRSLQEAAELAGKSAGLLKRWSARHHWQERMAAWDQAQAGHSTAALLRQAQAEAEEARQRYLRDGRDLQRLARAGIAGLVKRDPETGEPTLRRELKVQEIVALHRYGAELERLAFPQLTTEPSGGAPDGAEGELDRMLQALPQEDFSVLLAAARNLAPAAEAVTPPPVPAQPPMAPPAPENDHDQDTAA